MTLEEVIHLDGYAPNSNALKGMEGDEFHRGRERVFVRGDEELK